MQRSVHVQSVQCTHTPCIKSWGNNNRFLKAVRYGYGADVSQHQWCDLSKKGEKMSAVLYPKEIAVHYPKREGGVVFIRVSFSFQVMVRIFVLIDFLNDDSWIFFIGDVVTELMLWDALYYCPTAEIGTMDFLCKAHTRLLNWFVALTWWFRF